MHQPLLPEEELIESLIQELEVRGFTSEVLKESLRQKKWGQKIVFCPQEIQK
jgi:hypothetical protein